MPKKSDKPKKTYSLYLTPEYVDILRPFFSAAGVSLSGYFDEILKNLCSALAGTADVDYRKSFQDLTLREIAVMARQFESILTGKIDLSDAMTDEEKMEAEISGASLL
jgi:hypothetical protein